MSPAELRLQPAGETLDIILSGSWTQHGLNAARNAGQTTAVHEILAQVASASKLRLMALDVSDWDSSLVNLALQLTRAAEQEGLIVATELPDGAKQLLSLALAVPPTAQHAAPGSAGWKTFFGFLNPVRASRSIGGELAALFEFIGALLSAGFRSCTGKARVRLSDAFRFGYQTGPNALPIISLSSFLVGLILGYLGAVQLQQFGAGLYVANLVTIGVLREMGALMTAIIIAGRTGAAYAAQLGTMRVNEEIDAIEILGVSPLEFLVLPRVLAVLLMMPLLTLYADVLGIIGGGLVAGGLGISPLQYWTQAQSSLGIDHLLVGLVKAVLFGALIGIAGCRAGLAAGRNSEGVGKATTEAVVTALIYLIIADALVNIICQLLEI